MRITSNAKAIEDGFPFEDLSDIGEVESWRKEIYRPIYHLHKWWAQRLGSIFRGAIIGALAPKGANITKLFYQQTRFPDAVVFDPFMGSGTTVGEAHKLGCVAVGRDINPVAVRSVRAALGRVDRRKLQEAFDALDRTVGEELGKWYISHDSFGSKCVVLYYFWVKILPCPSCNHRVDLFSSYVFAKHAYATRTPTAQILCPHCGGINANRFDATDLSCKHCRGKFNPQIGPVDRAKATCPKCSHEFLVARTAKERGAPPEHRMYAKLVINKHGDKEYLPATDFDRQLYRKASNALKKEDPKIPGVRIRPGHNTNQVLNYGYSRWREFFNDRQLLGLTTLAMAIADLPSSPERDALAVLFSGVLEFNNMFVSFKGEGTGAVRHMFSHHILKPERTPLEANLWGTPRSSGSFSTLYASRLVRALDYIERPFEISTKARGGKAAARKVYGLSNPIGACVLDRAPNAGFPSGAVYLSCGNSTKTDLQDQSVDAVVTDPPFFDNVHYSELADFFYVWQHAYFKEHGLQVGDSTRHEGEVQDSDAARFALKLREVFAECHRVLKDQGLLVFSYHHSREEGWSAVAEAVLQAGFTFVQCQPVKSEMSVAAPKLQAKEPIDLDIMFVCRKAGEDERPALSTDEALRCAVEAANSKVARFNARGRKLSRNDVLIVLFGQIIVELCASRGAEEVLKALSVMRDDARAHVESIWAGQLARKERRRDADRQESLGLI